MNEEQGPDVVPGYANTSAQSSVVMFNRDDPGRWYLSGRSYDHLGIIFSEP